jgi:flagellar biosynthesis/type III secretory pathway protein FliH
MTDPMLTEAKLALDRLSMDPVARERAIKRDHELANFRYELELEHEKGLSAGRAEGLSEGLSAGRADGLRAAIEQLCGALDVELSVRRREALHLASISELEALHRRIAVDRCWPE